MATILDNSGEEYGYFFRIETNAVFDCSLLFMFFDKKRKSGVDDGYFQGTLGCWFESNPANYV